MRKRLLRFCLVCRVYLNHQSKVLSEKVRASPAARRVRPGPRSRGGREPRPGRGPGCVGAVRLLGEAVPAPCVSLGRGRLFSSDEGNPRGPSSRRVGSYVCEVVGARSPRTARSHPRSRPLGAPPIRSACRAGARGVNSRPRVPGCRARNLQGRVRPAGNRFSALLDAGRRRPLPAFRAGAPAFFPRVDFPSSRVSSPATCPDSSASSDARPAGGLLCGSFPGAELCPDTLPAAVTSRVRGFPPGRLCLAAARGASRVSGTFALSVCRACCEACWWWSRPRVVVSGIALARRLRFRGACLWGPPRPAALIRPRVGLGGCGH